MQPTGYLCLIHIAQAKLLFSCRKLHEKLHKSTIFC